MVMTRMLCTWSQSDLPHIVASMHSCKFHTSHVTRHIQPCTRASEHPRSEAGRSQAEEAKPEGAFLIDHEPFVQPVPLETDVDDDELERLLNEQKRLIMIELEEAGSGGEAASSGTAASIRPTSSAHQGTAR